MSENLPMPPEDEFKRYVCPRTVSGLRYVHPSPRVYGTVWRPRVRVNGRLRQIAPPQRTRFAALRLVLEWLARHNT